MHRRLNRIAKNLVLGSLAYFFSADAPRAEDYRKPPKIVAYVTSWSMPASLETSAGMLSHINYAFASVSSSGEVELGKPCHDGCDQDVGATYENLQRLARLKERYPNLKLLLSIGGWTSSKYFSDAAATDDRRRGFAHSVVDLVSVRWSGVFDGIDLDWEYPVSGGDPQNNYRSEDRNNLPLLVAELRRQLRTAEAAAGKHYLLTIAGPATLDTLENFDLAAMSDSLDWINVMAYDYHTGDSIAHFNAPLGEADHDPSPSLNVAATVSLYVGRGWPTDRLVLGVPFFGSGFAGVPSDNNGLFQAVASDLSDHDKTEWGVGSLPIREIARGAKARGFMQFWEPKASVPYLYHPQRKVWISFENSQSMAAKALFAKEQHLGGIMIWELDGDDGSLLQSISSQLSGNRSR